MQNIFSIKLVKQTIILNHTTMKNLTLIRLGIILMLGIGYSQNNKVEAKPSPMGVSFQVFYNELSPYGDWVMDQRHGYVWIPNVGQDFHPYGSNGYWEMTNYGNTWVSNYNWGWAPFHYGRWYWDDFYGWAWVPGYEWGPAWVNWRTGGGYYGWAPLGPGVGINISIGFHSNHWRFVPQRRFRHRHFHKYYVPSYNMVSIYNRTTVINNTYVYNNRTYVAGPSRREIERVTRGTVPVYQVNDSGRPGRASVNNRTLNVYRPEIDNSRSANAQARPSRAFTAEEYRGRASAQNRSSALSNGRSENSRNATISNQRNSSAQQNRAATSNRNQAISSQQRSQTRAAASQPNSRINTTQPNTRGQVRTAPSSKSTNRGGSVSTTNTRQSQVRTSPQQKRQSSPTVRQQRSSNNSSPRVTNSTNTRSNSPANVRKSAPSTRSTGTVRSTTSRPSTKAAPARSTSRSSGTTSNTRSRGGRGNN